MSDDKGLTVEVRGGRLVISVELRHIAAEVVEPMQGCNVPKPGEPLVESLATVTDLAGMGADIGAELERDDGELLATLTVAYMRCTTGRDVTWLKWSAPLGNS